MELACREQRVENVHETFLNAKQHVIVKPVAHWFQTYVSYWAFRHENAQFWKFHEHRSATGPSTHRHGVHQIFETMHVHDGALGVTHITFETVWKLKSELKVEKLVNQST
jgi:hypothetical protein